MYSVETEADLLRCFRQLDRGDVELAPDLELPLTVDGALSWSFGPRVYLLLGGQGGALPRGVVFHRNGGATPSVATMCQWCHRVGDRGRVKLLAVRAGSRRWIGQYLCSELDCLAPHDDERLPDVDGLRETTTAEARARRTLARMESFVTGRLF
jgi:hypothetical protein